MQATGKNSSMPANDGVHKPRSFRDLVSAWTRPIGELILIHQQIDRRLIDLIWLMEARKGALRNGHWDTKRSNPPCQTGGQRTGRFADLARSCFTDVAARATIDMLVDDLREGNLFRNTLVHGWWGGRDEKQLFLFSTPQAKWVPVTQEELEARGRKAYELIRRLYDFDAWVVEQNAEVTKQQKLDEQRRAIVRLVRARAGPSGLRLLRRAAIATHRGQGRSPRCSTPSRPAVPWLDPRRG
jgi:hypothetical protein